VAESFQETIGGGFRWCNFSQGAYIGSIKKKQVQGLKRKDMNVHLRFIVRDIYYNNDHLHFDKDN